MRECHVSPEDFYRQMAEYGGVGTHLDAFRANVHLLKQCPECRQRVLEHFGLASIQELEAMEDPWEELTLRRQRIESEPLLAELDGLTESERMERAREDERFWTEAAVQGLLARCRERWFAAPREALGYSQAALEVAPHLRAEETRVVEPHNLASLAWAYHGNTLRILSDLRGAASAFQQAEGALASGPGDDLVLAEVLALRSSLLRDQRRLDEALAAMDRAVALFGRCDQAHLQGEGLLNRAYIRTEAGDREGALADLRQAVPLLNPHEGPRLPFVAAGIELHLLCEMGRWEDARALVPRAQRLARQHGSSTDRLRVRWCEGRIATALGTTQEAEAALREVREGFGREGIAYDAALVSLDLAVLYAEQGRTAELRLLATEMVPIFRSRDVPAEALAAALLFCQAAVEEAVSVELLARLRKRLEQARSG